MLGIRFVPGSRLAVVLGLDEFIALVDTDTDRTVRFTEHRDDPDDFAPSTPSVSADGKLLATRQSIGGNAILVGLRALPSGRSVGDPLVVDREIREPGAEPGRAAGLRRRSRTRGSKAARSRRGTSAHAAAFAP